MYNIYNPNDPLHQMKLNFICNVLGPRINRQYGIVVPFAVLKRLMSSNTDLRISALNVCTYIRQQLKPTYVTLDEEDGEINNNNLSQM